MTNRRELLQTGVTLSALPLAVDALLPRVADASPAASRLPLSVPIARAVFDDRYADARAFAAEAARAGVRTYALQNGDPSNLWYDELDPLWRREPVGVAGVTQFGPMFVLEQLGREHGLRLVRRVELSPRREGDGVTGPPDPVIHYYTPYAIGRGESPPWDAPLFSWLIAPRV